MQDILDTCNNDDKDTPTAAQPERETLPEQNSARIPEHIEIKTNNDADENEECAMQTSIQGFY